MKQIQTLEDILRKYKFAPKHRAVFRKNRIWIDDLPDDMTKTGHKAYHKLICLLYDIAKVTNDLSAVNKLVDTLDQITSEGW